MIVLEIMLAVISVLLIFMLMFKFYLFHKLDDIDGFSGTHKGADNNIIASFGDK